MARINVRNSAHVMTLVQSLVYAYVATLTVADLTVGIRMRYLAILGEDFIIDMSILVCGESCFVQCKPLCYSLRLAPR